MAQTRTRGFFIGAARLMDLGGLLAQRGERNPQAAAERAFQGAWASIDSALLDGVKAVEATALPEQRATQEVAVSAHEYDPSPPRRPIIRRRPVIRPRGHVATRKS